MVRFGFATRRSRFDVGGSRAPALALRRLRVDDGLLALLFALALGPRALVLDLLREQRRGRGNRGRLLRRRRRQREGRRRRRNARVAALLLALWRRQRERRLGRLERPLRLAEDLAIKRPRATLGGNEPYIGGATL